MKKVIIVIFLIFTVCFVHAQKSGATKAVSKKTVEFSLSELEYDFGQIPQGKPVTHKFLLTNTGKDSLKIADVHASCGCTTPEWEKEKAIAPGGQTYVNVGFNAAVPGNFTKEITIIYNGDQSKVIKIKGDVWQAPTTSAPENNELNNLKNL